MVLGEWRSPRITPSSTARVPPPTDLLVKNALSEQLPASQASGCEQGRKPDADEVEVRLRADKRQGEAQQPEDGERGGEEAGAPLP